MLYLSDKGGDAISLSQGRRCHISIIESGRCHVFIIEGGRCYISLTREEMQQFWL